MKRYRETTIKKVMDLDAKEETSSESINSYVVKTWNELTIEEKEKEIERNSQLLYERFQEDRYENFKYDIEDIKDRYKDIKFEDIFIDSNSQGNWIDRISKFEYINGIEIYGEYIEVYGIDFHICKYIKEISENDLYFDNIYAIPDDKLEKIKKTKKYKNWIKEIVERINNWIKEINNVCCDLMKVEYYTPYDLDNEEDREYLDYFFEDTEFTYDLEEVENEEVLS